MENLSQKRTVLLYSTAVYALLGLLLINFSLWLRDDAFDKVGHVHQVAIDWDTQPLIGLTVTTDPYCPNGTDPLFERLWYGTDLYCVCREPQTWRHYHGECNLGDPENCFQLPALHAVRMAQFNGVRVCGIRDGLSFKDVTRPGPDEKCPEDTEPCVKTASPENTVCYAAADHQDYCPVTRIDVVSSNQAMSLQAQGYQVAQIGGDKAVVYSRDFDSLPITTIKVDNQPCVQSWKTSSSSSTSPLPSELQTEVECVPDQPTGLVYDERFEAVTAWEMSELNIMKENGVYEELYHSEPESVMSSDPNIDYENTELLKKNRYFSWDQLEYSSSTNSEQTRESNMLKLWTRPTINWSLECETTMSRADAFDIFSMELERVGFSEYYKEIGVFIILMVVMPWLQYYRLTKSERQASLFLRLEPICSRLFFVFMFEQLGAISAEQSATCGTNITQVAMLGTTNTCIDQYSQVDASAILDSLRSTQSSLGRYQLAYWLLFFVALAELASMIYFAMKDLPEGSRLTWPSWSRS